MEHAYGINREYGTPRQRREDGVVDGRTAVSARPRAGGVGGSQDGRAVGPVDHTDCALARSRRRGTPADIHRPLNLARDPPRKNWGGGGGGEVDRINGPESDRVSTASPVACCSADVERARSRDFCAGKGRNEDRSSLLEVRERSWIVSAFRIVGKKKQNKKKTPGIRLYFVRTTSPFVYFLYASFVHSSSRWNRGKHTRPRRNETPGPHYKNNITPSA